MIVEKLENWRALFGGAVWEQAFAALAALTAESPEGRTDLLGEGGGDMNRRVMEYETRPAEEAVLEAHRDYIDIHILLRGAERIDWFPTSELQVRTPYEAGKDAAFYERPAGPAPASVVLRPGMFAVMFPADAHLTQVMVEERAETIKKGLIKLRVGLAGKQE